MWLVIVPMVLLFAIILLPIPKIGGNVIVGLLGAALAAAVLGGLAPREVLSASIFGIDKLAWVIMLSIVGSVYAESQVRLGAMQTALDLFRALFGRSSAGLVCAVMLTLVLSGSLLGDAIAAATVVGLLVIPTLSALKLSGERIAVIIVMGAVIGSGMPPISQSFYLAASFTGIEPGQVLGRAYATMGISVVVAMAVGAWLVRDVDSRTLLEAPAPLRQVVRRGWTTLVPMSLLLAIVVAASLGFNIFTRTPLVAEGVAMLQQVPILKGLAFRVVLAILVALLVSLAFRRVREQGGALVAAGLRNVAKTVQIQVCAGIMVGVFYQAGLIDTVQQATAELAPHLMALAGGLATIAVGMLTGSQTTAQTLIVSMMAPALTHLGKDPAAVAAGAAHLAMAGQSMPPVGLTTFVVTGLVGGIIGIKVDPVKTMMMALPVTLYFMSIGFAFWLLG
ncbi:TRAP transporter large permease subunit [Salinicola avicenniae]|uniref:TRAP transporter large permease subunit n=1 Tax=Salinicola avicenniae TaxID=2916836 RepID=UPI0020748B9F|nr:MULTISPECIES: TRAP transporter large permease subunit [unclassified Salinicola]